MIDTVGRGIKKIFMEQKKRYFPMPDYEIDNQKRSVGVTIYGKIIDEKYSKLLKETNELSLKECIWLDSIQKGREITEDAIAKLKDKKLIEGRKPNYRISVKVAKLTHQLGKYSREKGLETADLEPLIISLAKNAGEDGFRRVDAFEAISHLLPTSKSNEQKMRFVGHLLGDMAKRQIIESKDKLWYLITT